MKLELARGLFLLLALAVATAAAAAWEEPRPQVVSKVDPAAQCPPPRLMKSEVSAQPDPDLLLFLFGMSQSLRSQ
ncbi:MULTISPECIES: hypothetical protein [Pseudomonas]|uniref:Uncharacterized protein n=1 Tax=Pseudomonas sp. Hg7Tf TaxID=3236988 RepID=A0AB39HXL8_9PSED|nr:MULTISPECIES: hypothetical protein [Pseudomonas]KJK04380.1 hypothetical protein UB47_23665 [Pseudomonas sp. 5]MDD1979694.1 hypothetical protein [Pseudomonas putida]MDH2561466.1 hypothetical protein [Pseudomonas sp. Hg5Tf]QYX47308.1 hypothetical protein K3F43_21955 [Pseudomonas sp. S11A 273]